MPDSLKELFHKSFKGNEPIQITEWLNSLNSYKRQILLRQINNEIYPEGLMVPPGEGYNAKCSDCKKIFKIHRTRYDKLKLSGKEIYCSKCQQERKLKEPGGLRNGEKNTNSTPPEKIPVPIPNPSSGPKSKKDGPDDEEFGCGWIIVVIILLGIFVFGINY